jgi:hypothetical protein
MSGVSGLSEDQVHEIGISAYIYLYPLLTMDVTRKQTTNIEPGKMPGRGPVNTFSHIREFPAADFKVVVRPNFDTLYSSAWLDLGDGPMVVSACADSDAPWPCQDPGRQARPAADRANQEGTTYPP